MNTVPKPIPFKYKGKMIQFHPFKVGDHLELAEYLRGKYITEAKKQLVGLPGFLAKHAWDSAKAYCDNIQPGRDEYTKAFNTSDGIAYAFLIQLRKVEPNIALEDCIAYIDENAETLAKVSSSVGFEAPDPLAEAG